MFHTWVNVMLTLTLLDVGGRVIKSSNESLRCYLFWSSGIFRALELRYQGGGVRKDHRLQYLEKPISNRVNSPMNNKYLLKMHFFERSIFQTFWKPHCCAKFLFIEFETSNFGYLLIFQFCWAVQSFSKIGNIDIRHFIRIPILNFGREIESKRSK